MQPADYRPGRDLKNPAVEHVFEPGSTFKIVTAAAALEEHRVSPTDTFFCENGSWDIPGRTIHDHENEGWLTFTLKSSARSSNIGTAKSRAKAGPRSALPVCARLRLLRHADAANRPAGGWRSGNFAPNPGVAPKQPGDDFVRTGSGSHAASDGQCLYSDHRQRRMACSSRVCTKALVDENGHYREWATPPRRFAGWISALRTVALLKTILKRRGR